jgi:hypothetical protein
MSKFFAIKTRDLRYVKNSTVTEETLILCLNKPISPKKGNERGHGMARRYCDSPPYDVHVSVVFTVTSRRNSEGLCLT